MLRTRSHFVPRLPGSLISLDEAGGTTREQIKLITQPSPTQAFDYYARQRIVWLERCRVVLAIRLPIRRSGRSHQRSQLKVRKRKRPTSIRCGRYREWALQVSKLRKFPDLCDLSRTPRRTQAALPRTRGTIVALVRGRRRAMGVTALPCPRSRPTYSSPAAQSSPNARFAAERAKPTSRQSCPGRWRKRGAFWSGVRRDHLTGSRSLRGPAARHPRARTRGNGNRRRVS